jgi:hypothetical protein
MAQENALKALVDGRRWTAICENWPVVHTDKAHQIS